MLETHQRGVHEALVGMEGEAERLYREERPLLDDDSKWVQGGGGSGCGCIMQGGGGGGCMEVCVYVSDCTESANVSGVKPPVSHRVLHRH